MPLDRSDIHALKLGLTPLRILMPDREIKRRGVARGGDIMEFNDAAGTTYKDRSLFEKELQDSERLKLNL